MVVSLQALAEFERQLRLYREAAAVAGGSAEMSTPERERLLVQLRRKGLCHQRLRQAAAASELRRATQAGLDALLSQGQATHCTAVSVRDDMMT